MQAPKNTKERVLPPEGTHIARVISLIDLGTVPGYQGELQHKLRIVWELPEELHTFKEGEDAKPLTVGQDFTFSMGSKANLRPVVEGIIGTTLTDQEADSFGFENILNQPCLVSLKYKISKAGNKRAEVASVSKLMKGQICKEAFYPIQKLSFDEWNEGVFNSLPEYFKNLIQTTPEYKKMTGVKEGIDSDSIPF